MSSNSMNNLVKQTVRDLRKRQTKQEKIFWDAVRNRKFCGKKFLRQYPITFEYYGRQRFFIADFYNSESKLVVEIDGGIHEKQEDYDKLRDYLISKLGMRVIRFKNKEVEDNVYGILEKVKRYF